MAQSIDLRKLVMMINEKKGLNAQLALEFDCGIEVEDPSELVKVLNYVINYCSQLSDKPLNIALNDQMDEYLLSFSIMTDKTEIPPFSDQVAETMQSFDAKHEVKFEPGKWVQIILSFF